MTDRHGELPATLLMSIVEQCRVVSSADGFVGAGVVYLVLFVHRICIHSPFHLFPLYPIERATLLWTVLPLRYHSFHPVPSSSCVPNWQSVCTLSTTYPMFSSLSVCTTEDTHRSLFRYPVCVCFPLSSSASIMPSRFRFSETSVVRLLQPILQKDELIVHPYCADVHCLLFMSIIRSDRSIRLPCKLNPLAM